MVRQGGLEPDAFMYKVLIHAYCKCERASLALRIFEHMWNYGQLPNVTTKDFLVKSLWKKVLQRGFCRGRAERRAKQCSSTCFIRAYVHHELFRP
nr:pentatricopeptide repeat-containing protein At5g66631 isoform X2 [Ipomoea trifida]